MDMFGSDEEIIPMNYIADNVKSAGLAENFKCPVKDKMSRERKLSKMSGEEIASRRTF